MKARPQVAMIAVLYLPLALYACSSVAQSADISLQATLPTAAGVHDFDFLIGHWDVHHRRLKISASGAEEWMESDGTVNEIVLMEGQGNVEDFYMIRDGIPFHAAALRAFDPKSRDWSIWWLDGRAPVSPIDPPVVGHFENGVGSFYAEDIVEGKKVRTRFMWTYSGATRAHWEQALSIDGGKSWKTNWTMEFTRK